MSFSFIKVIKSGPSVVVLRKGEQDEGKWVTMHGSPVLIREGQSAEDAAKERFGGEGKKPEESKEPSPDVGLKIPPDMEGPLLKYTGNGFRQINKRLRASSSVAETETVKKLDEFITKVDGNDSDTLYRGITGKSSRGLSELKVGDEIADKAFSSASVDKSIAAVFAESPIFGTGEYSFSCLMTIKGMKGIGGAIHKTFIRSEIGGKSEKEVILPRGMRFKVDSSSRGKNGTLNIVVSAVRSENKSIDMLSHLPLVSVCKGDKQVSTFQERMSDIEVEVVKNAPKGRSS